MQRRCICRILHKTVVLVDRFSRGRRPVISIDGMIAPCQRRIGTIINLTGKHFTANPRTVISSHRGSRKVIWHTVVDTDVLWISLQSNLIRIDTSGSLSHSTRKRRCAGAVWSGTRNDIAVFINELVVGHRCTGERMLIVHILVCYVVAVLPRGIRICIAVRSPGHILISIDCRRFVRDARTVTADDPLGIVIAACIISVIVTIGDKPIGGCDEVPVAIPRLAYDGVGSIIGLGRVDRRRICKEFAWRDHAGTGHINHTCCAVCKAIVVYIQFDAVVCRAVHAGVRVTIGARNRLNVRTWQCIGTAIQRNGAMSWLRSICIKQCTRIRGTVQPLELLRPIVLLHRRAQSEVKVRPCHICLVNDTYAPRLIVNDIVILAAFTEPVAHGTIDPLVLNILCTGIRIRCKRSRCTVVSILAVNVGSIEIQKLPPRSDNHAVTCKHAGIIIVRRTRRHIPVDGCCIIRLVHIIKAQLHFARCDGIVVRRKRTKRVSFGIDEVIVVRIRGVDTHRIIDALVGADILRRIGRRCCVRRAVSGNKSMDGHEIVPILDEAPRICTIGPDAAIRRIVDITRSVINLCQRTVNRCCDILARDIASACLGQRSVKLEIAACIVETIGNRMRRTAHNVFIVIGSVGTVNRHIIGDVDRIAADPHRSTPEIVLHCARCIAAAVLNRGVAVIDLRRVGKVCCDLACVDSARIDTSLCIAHRIGLRTIVFDNIVSCRSVTCRKIGKRTIQIAVRHSLIHDAAVCITADIGIRVRAAHLICSRLIEGERFTVHHATEHNIACTQIHMIGSVIVLDFAHKVYGQSFSVNIALPGRRT